MGVCLTPTFLYPPRPLIRMLLHRAASKCQNSHKESKNGSERTSLCTPKVIQKVFFQNIFGAIMHVMDCSCACILRFSPRRQMAPQQTVKIGTARFRQFRSTLMKDSVASYGSIWTPFTQSVRGLDALYNALNGS